MGQKNLAQKARARPDLVKQVVDRARDQGIRSTITTVRDRLDGLTPIGYSSSGVVLEVGAGVEGLAPGDRVACGGGGWANHAEVVAVPKNLIARLPDNVSFEAGAYATVGAIALHGFRQAEATLGDVVGIVGLGLVGQLATSLALASGCTVVGIDPDPSALELARAAGASALSPAATELAAIVGDLTAGRGLDSVLVCAASSSADPVATAAALARERARIVIVGEVPVEIDRSVAYEKELEVRLARSYGPGRYDRDYEERGRDLPAGYVRWTEQRNIQAFVDLAGSGRLDPTRLTTHRFALEHAPDAYALLSGGNGSERPFGIVLEYEETTPTRVAPRPVTTRRSPAGETVGVAFIGAGNFARATLLPAFTAAGARLVAVASQSGLTAGDGARRLGFERVAADLDEVAASEDVDAVVIATRHGSHAELATRALAAGKAVFVEKPLALSSEGLQAIQDALTPDSLLMVGFNRRYAPLVNRLSSAFGSRPPEGLLLRVNAGALAPDHWLNDPEEGGGRLLGEGCHFVDLAAHLSASKPVSVYASAAAPPTGPIEACDTFAVTIAFASGATAQILYTGGGDSALGKERIEAFGHGVAAILDDYRRLEIYANRKRNRQGGDRDKGHRAQVAAFVAAVSGRGPRPDAASYVTSTRATIASMESLRTGSRVLLEER
jgi:polar amino acid transport system substrate-binding protein